MEYSPNKENRDSDLIAIRTRLSEIELLLLDIRHNSHIAATRPMPGSVKQTGKAAASAATKGGRSGK